MHGRSSRARIQAGRDLIDGPAKTGIAFERVVRDVAKRLREGIRRRASRLSAGNALRQHLDEHDAERPDVARGSERLICGFRRVVGAAFRGRLTNFSGGKEAIGRKLDLIAGG